MSIDVSLQFDFGLFLEIPLPAIHPLYHPSFVFTAKRGAQSHQADQQRDGDVRGKLLQHEQVIAKLVRAQFVAVRAPKHDSAELDEELKKIGKTINGV